MLSPIRRRFPRRTRCATSKRVFFVHRRNFRINGCEPLYYQLPVPNEPVGNSARVRRRTSTTLLQLVTGRKLEVVHRPCENSILGPRRRRRRSKAFETAKTAN